MGPIGMGEIIVLFILALLIFGPKKLPELGKTFGKGMAEFKRASNELKSTFQREMDNIEHETREVKNISSEVSRDISTSYYDDNEDDYYSDYDYDGSQSSTTPANSSSKASENGDSSPVAAEDPAEDPAEATAAAETPAEPDTDAAPADVPDAHVSGLPESEAVAEPKPA
jgi:sec-independent protein translocase protein TatA